MIEKHKIAEEALFALDVYAGAATVVVATVNPEPHHGPGVAVKYRDELYILTADHVLANELDNQS